MSTYCDYAPDDPVHASYHNTEYGFPTTDETALMERLAMEIFQAGLSWGLVLKKRQSTNDAFRGYDVDKVADFNEKDIERLLADPGIIRNKLKVNAIIENAKRIRAMRDSHGGFSKWIEAHYPMPKPEWVKLFKKTFKFTGGEITGEFLMSTGYLPGSHRPDCATYKVIEKVSPAWMQVDAKIYD
ncbi:DNA-3-methyladenine glycosylase I [Rhodospirillales bacterium]|jgi:DNA-3-methyladenine glycosylase I|nr:DNA-3-methyladenine glycosylase I [Rhodospirillales bacterium]MDC1212985.1 DNA-3-methyladenine glycosylase I [Rhodospirillales bacterium]